jgi:hypothetical protein
MGFDVQPGPGPVTGAGERPGTAAAAVAGRRAVAQAGTWMCLDSDVPGRHLVETTLHWNCVVAL